MGLFIMMLLAVECAEARSLFICDALGLAQFGKNLTSINKSLAPEVTVETTLEEIHNSYSFFNFPVFDEGTPQLTKICPGFKDMKSSEKEEFWKYFWNQLAQYESSGKMIKNDKAHRGPACGYLQLHCELKKRILSIKKDFIDYCQGEIYFDPAKPQEHPLTSPLTAGANSFKCGMAMLQNQVDNTNEIFPEKSKQKKVYWEPLQAPEKMYNKICNYKDCGNSAATCEILVKERQQELK